MKRSELKRTTPLKRSAMKRAGGGLCQGKPLTRTPMKRTRAKPAVPAERKEQLTVRAGGVCEIQLPGCHGRGQDPSHRITQKTGGRHGAAKLAHDCLSNVMLACRSCHDWIGAHPDEARGTEADGPGWVLREGDDPPAWVVLYRGRRALLLPDALFPHYL